MPTPRGVIHNEGQARGLRNAALRTSLDRAIRNLVYTSVQYAVACEGPQLPEHRQLLEDRMRAEARTKELIDSMFPRSSSRSRSHGA